MSDMKITAEDVTESVKKVACDQLDQCLTKIDHCLKQLNEEQLWWRPQPDMNSIGNLLLHLSGNVQQWIVCGVGGAVDDRDRPSEFAEQGPIDVTTLWDKLTATVAAAQDAIRNAEAGSLLEPRSIQGFDVIGWGAMFDAISHFKGHTQEIIALTRMQLAAGYQFHWEPAPSDEEV